MQQRANALIRDGKTIAFVPTMGYLHEGHLTLLREAKKHGNHIVLSIFVNPTQFGANEDLDSYPRDHQRDLTLAEEAGADTVFLPEKETIYGGNYQTYVTLEKLPNHLCGISRPVHFRGVATVVSKLFNIVKPTVAMFGEKDFQQLAVIKQMTKDLNFDIQIIGVPTVREADGLAKSSRNVYLSPEQRKTALSLQSALKKAQDLVGKGEKNAQHLIKEAEDRILSFPETSIDYLTICDPETLEDVSEINGPTLFAMAVMVGKTRLIDNKVLMP